MQESSKTTRNQTNNRGKFQSFTGDHIYNQNLGLYLLKRGLLIFQIK